MRAHAVRTEGLTQHVIEAGSGPLVLLVHGFPELSVSWRPQVKALAEAGYRAVAPDMRGYGASERPDAVEAYSILRLVGDMVDLVRALGEDDCVVVGHDWGAPVAWWCALLRPDVFRAVAGLSVPWRPRSPHGPPVAAMRALSARAGLGDLYIVRFQDPRAAVALDADPATALRKMFWAYDGATPAEDRHTGFLQPGVDLLDSISDRATLPPWMTAEHFEAYVSAFTAGGFSGPLNWYRNLDRDWALTAFAQGLRIRQPSLFIVGENDPVRRYSGRHEDHLADVLDDFRGRHVLPGAGHWLQQERPEEVSRLLLDFLAGL